MTEPTTEAGRSLLVQVTRRVRTSPSWRGVVHAKDILAIEAEAAASVRAELAEKVRALVDPIPHEEGPHAWGWEECRDDVLEILDAPPPASPRQGEPDGLDGAKHDR